MKAIVFPGQASQFQGMGKDLFENSEEARSFFAQADGIMGFELSKIMFEGSEKELLETLVTQPSVFLFSYLKYILEAKDLTKAAVAGHSLGEFTALVAAECLTFEEGLQLVKTRATAMQKACEENPGTMSAVVGMPDEKVEGICNSIDEIVIAANFNCPGQVVISGSLEGVAEAEKNLQENGAKRVIRLAVGGAFHSPLMSSAENELKRAIEQIHFREPKCPVYQNVSARAETDPQVIQEQLVAQLTSPVRWTQIMQNMLDAEIDEFIECGGKVLSGFVKRVNRRIPTTPLI